MPTPAEKGDALHRAVRAIEQYILATSPSLKEKTFIIEEKKIFCIDGVHHEVDIFVTVDPAPGYAALHIFECKNWKQSVGKKEIVDFSEKIRALNAAKGYFVAKSFTKDARSQAKKDGRLKLLTASEHDPALMMIPGDLHTIFSAPESIQANFRKRGSDAQPQPLDVRPARAILDGAAIDLHDYLAKWADEVAHEGTRTFPSGKLPPGRYPRKAHATRHFSPQQLIVNGEEMGSATITTHFNICVYRPRITSQFDVETRGRVLCFEPIVLPQGQMFEMNIVSAPEGFPGPTPKPPDPDPPL